MSHAVARAVGTGILTIVVWVLATFLLCSRHQKWVRAQADGASAIVERGERVAPPGDAILVCETWHHVGPFAVHRDLDCYCAPRTLTADAAGSEVSGSCYVDKPDPSFADDWGRCRYGRCQAQVGH